MGEIGEHLAESTHRPITHPQRVDQHTSGLFNSSFGEVCEFAGDDQHLGFGVIGAAPQLRPDPMRTLTSQRGLINELGSWRDASRLKTPDHSRDPSDALGQQTRVGGVLDVSRDHGRVRTQPTHVDHTRFDPHRDDLRVDRVDSRRAATGGDLHQRRRVRCSLTKRDPTEPQPRQRVRHLAAQRLEPEPIAVLQEHQPQIRLHRDRRPTEHRIEPSPERLEEPRIVQQHIHRHELDRHHQRLRRQQRLPQRRANTYSSQHGMMAPILRSQLRSRGHHPPTRTETRAHPSPATTPTISGAST
jgi:hypothetical protein